MRRFPPLSPPCASTLTPETTSIGLEAGLEEWLAGLAAGTETPASGSALALTAATAAALVAKAARLSVEAWPDAAAFASQARALLERAAPLALEDAEAYAEALAAHERTAGLTAERRDHEIGRAYARAAEPPLKIARIAGDIAELAAETVQRCDPAVRADATAAAVLAAAAARAAVALIAVNLTAVPTDARVAEATELAQVAAHAAARAEAGLR